MEKLKPNISRRDFLKIVAFSVGAKALQGCTGSYAETPVKTQVPTTNLPLPTGTVEATDFNGNESNASTQTDANLSPTQTTETSKATITPEININDLRKWGSELMGECGVPYPEKLVGVTGIENIVIESSGGVVNKGEGYQLQLGEEKLTQRIITRFNQTGQLDAHSKPVIFDEIRVKFLLFHVQGKDKEGREAETPLVIIYQKDAKDPINKVNAFLGFKLTEKVETVPPGKEGEDANIFLELIQKGSLDNGGKIALGIPLSFDPRTEEGKYMADPPLFEISKNEEGKIKIEFTMPPYLDVIDANLKSSNPIKSPKLDITNETNSIKVMASLIPADPEIKSAMYEEIRQETANKTQDLIERNSLSNPEKQKQIVEGINKFFEDPEAYHKDGRPHFLDPSGNPLGLSYFSDKSWSDLKRDGENSYQFFVYQHDSGFN